MSEELEYDVDAVELDPGAIEASERPGVPTGFTCPECHGALWELRDGDLIRFRCRVGHAFSSDTLVDEQVKALEAAIWTALRALEENAMLMRRLETRAQKHGRHETARRYERQARTIEERAAVVRKVLLAGPLGTPPESAAEPRAALGD